MRVARFNKYRFPIREANHFALLVDSDTFFDKMLAAIHQAQHFILLEQYLVKSGRLTDQFIQQLQLAAQRGVAVYLMFDDYGANGLLAGDRQKLEQAGIQVCYFNPVHFKRFFHSLFRNHRKSLIVDNQLAFVGGAGMADEFSRNVSGPLAWHDIMLEIHGNVVQDWLGLFVQTWQAHTSQPISLPDIACQPHPDKQTGRLLASNPFRRQEIKQALINQLRRAKHRVWITSPYFVVPRKIRRIIRQTARRGVDVRLLLPGPHSDHPWISHAARRNYMRMLTSQVRIFEYQPRFIHAKMQLCDDWVSIGSSNLDRWNQRWNLDANQAICDVDFADQIARQFELDFSLSKEISLQDWRRRPPLTRLREGLSGLIIFWLERLFRIHR